MIKLVALMCTPVVSLLFKHLEHLENLECGMSFSLKFGGFILDGKFKIEVSARHVHLNREAIDILFGKGHELQQKKALSQPGQFACLERVVVVGPKSKIENVSVLGPERNEVQVEVSATDARALGIKTFICESGHLESTPGCELVGPCGSLKLTRGLIVAKRHIHASVDDARRLGVVDGQQVWVKVLSKQRQLIFGDVVVRVSNSYALAMHIDTDEANAACCGAETFGEVFQIN